MEQTVVLVFTASLSLVGNGWIIYRYIYCRKRITDALFALAFSDFCNALLFFLQGLWTLVDLEQAKDACTTIMLAFNIFFPIQSCLWMVSLSYQLLNNFQLHDPSEIMRSDLIHHAINIGVGLSAVIFNISREHKTDPLTFSRWGMCWTIDTGINV